MRDDAAFLTVSTHHANGRAEVCDALQRFLEQQDRSLLGALGFVRLRRLNAFMRQEIAQTQKLLDVREAALGRLRASSRSAL